MSTIMVLTCLYTAGQNIVVTVAYGDTISIDEIHVLSESYHKKGRAQISQVNSYSNKLFIQYGSLQQGYIFLYIYINTNMSLHCAAEHQENNMLMHKQKLQVLK